MSQYLLIFIVLQALDLLTTVYFLSLGVQEANPLIRAAMAELGPLHALLAIKGIALVIAIGCAMDRRARLLYRANCLYLLVVGWNMAHIAVQL